METAAIVGTGVAIFALIALILIQYSEHKNNHSE